MLGSQKKMKSCFFCPNCCFPNLKVKFGFHLLHQAPLPGQLPRRCIPGSILADRLKVTVGFCSPNTPGQWVAGGPKFTGSVWAGLG